ncbi:hypothetical protein O3G_MSEX011683 [Manduca sexta]|uniref:CRAL-TRIO domain-containing protein n=1 Tax=Manduca sexta TaxID=7130 RepID=A0A922CVT2_MANSE|nr:hypothetical protein O3G_MSEX011683 [Manduca sexta]
MERIPKNPILQFHPDTMECVRKLCNFNTQLEVKEAVDLLDEWVKKQSHYRKRNFTRSYLEKTIIINKGSVERAKTQIDQLCALKTIMPTFFEKCHARDELGHLKSYCIQGLLPKLTPEHYRVYIGKFRKDGLTSYTDIFRFGVLINEYLKEYDYCNGLVLIADIRDINVLRLSYSLSLTELRNILTIATEGYDMRIKGIHYVTSSRAVEVLLRLMRSVLSAKLSERMRVHKTVESLYEVVSKEILPAEYGGDEESLLTLYDKWVEELSEKKNVDYFKEMREIRAKEGVRQTEVYRSQYCGLAGTFRKLNID